MYEGVTYFPGLVLPSVQQLQKRNATIEDVHNFTQLDGPVDFLRPYIWSCLSGPLLLRDVSNNEYALNVVPSSEKQQRRHAFREESMCRTRVF